MTTAAPEYDESETPGGEVDDEFVELTFVESAVSFEGKLVDFEEGFSLYMLIETEFITGDSIDYVFRKGSGFGGIDCYEPYDATLDDIYEYITSTFLSYNLLV